MLINSPNISGSLTVTGNSVITGSLTVLGGINAAITGSATSASYVEYNNVANKPTLISGSEQISFNGITDKPTLVSGSSQVTYSGLTGVPAGIVSGSSQISFNGIVDKPTLVSGSSQVTYSGLSGIPAGIVSSSTQVGGYGIFATTGSNTFVGSQTITGSIFGTGNLTINGCITATGQIVAQTINVQQVTSSIVYSCGSNIFGTSISNTQQFTGSMLITGSNITANVGTACFSGNVCAPAFVGGTVSGTSGTFTGKLSVSQASTDFVGEFINTSATNPYGLRVVDASGAANNYPLFQVVNNAGTVEYFRVNSGTGLSTFSGIACFACQVCAPTALITNNIIVGTTYGTTAQFSFGSITDAQTTANLTDAGVRCGILEVLATGGSAGNGGALVLGTDTWGTGIGKGQIALKSLLVNGAGCGTSDLAFSLRNDPSCSNLTERMRITVGGCVGINTNNPQSILDVQNCINSSYDPTNTLISNQWFRTSNPSTTACATSGIMFVAQGPGGGNGISTINGVTTSCGSMAITFGTRDASGSITEKLRIASGGNVGIGTVTPDSVLEIRGSTASPQFRISRSELTNQGLTIQAGGGVTSFNSYDGTDTVFGGYVFNGTKCNTTVERMRITTDGVACFACQVRVQGDIVISSTSAKFYQLTNNCKSADSVLDIYNTATNGFGVSVQAGANNNNYALAVTNFQSTPLLYVAGNGQVGIGCGTPNAKLTINNGNSFSSIRIYGTNPSYISQLGWYDSTNLNQESDGVGGGRVALIEIGTVAGSGTGCRGANMGLYTHEANGSLKQPLLLMHNGNVCLPQGNLYTTCTLFAPGTPIQIASGTATFTSGNSGQTAGLGSAVGGTTPAFDGGCVIVSISFTPKSANSKLLIQTNNVAMWETINVSDHFYIWASNDTAGNVLTKAGSYLANFGVCSNNGAIINLNGTADSWGTSANTISFRVGSTGGTSNYQYNPFYGAGGFNADTVGHFSYTIMEIAQ